MTIEEANSKYAGKLLAYEDKTPRFLIVGFTEGLTILKPIGERYDFSTRVDILSHIIKGDWFALLNNDNTIKYEIY